MSSERHIPNGRGGKVTRKPGKVKGKSGNEVAGKPGKEVRDK